MRLRLLPTRATFFDTPARTHYVTRAEQITRLEAVPLAAALLEGVGSPAALLNADREIVMANERLATFAGVPRAHLLGRRLGEVVGCVNAFEPPNGCGTTEACACCGAAQAIHAARADGHGASSDCRIAVAPDHPSDAINANVTCTPLDINDVPVVMVVVTDTSDTLRRHALERVFFHDAPYTTDGLRGLAEAWRAGTAGDADGSLADAWRVAEQLANGIEAHRDLVAAENGTLVVRLAPIDPRALLEDLCAEHGRHETAQGTHVACDVPRVAAVVMSDRALLRRVLGNLTTNALEASAAGETVTLRYRAAGGAAIFEVHNPGVMPAATQLQVFQRAFTTRGRGRGLGTYGAKLIAERHLGATLDFLSAASLGTTFALHLPR